jgi:predicted RNase H-like nuclease (RuvC/YqgF family)
MIENREAKLREIDMQLAENDAHLAAIHERGRELDAADKALKAEQRGLRRKIKAAEAELRELERHLSGAGEASADDGSADAAANLSRRRCLTRQPDEQNRACSRLGANMFPQPGRWHWTRGTLGRVTRSSGGDAPRETVTHV